MTTATKTKGLRQTAKGWEFSVSYRGNRKQGVCNTKAEALAKKKALKEQLILIDACPPPVTPNYDLTLTLGEAVRLTTLKRWNHIASKDSALSNIRCVTDFLGDDKLLHEIRIDDLAAMQQYFISINSPRTVNKKLLYLKTVMNDAVTSRALQFMPEWPRNVKVRNFKDRVYSIEEEQQFLEWFRSNDHDEMADLFAFALDTCGRFKEYEKLKVWDVDIKAKRVTFEDRKANNTGSVPMTQRALAIAKKYRHRKKFLFDVPQWQMIERINDCKEALGIDDKNLTFHSCRHTCATRLAEANISLPLIMRMGGWTDPKSCRRYMHVQTDALGACIEVLEG